MPRSNKNPRCHIHSSSKIIMSLRTSICLTCMMSLYDTFAFEYCNDSYSQIYNISQMFSFYVGNEPVAVPQVIRVLMGAIVNGTKGTARTKCFTCTHGLLQDIFSSFAIALSPRLEKLMDASILHDGKLCALASDGTFVPLADHIMKNDFGMASTFKCSNIQVIYELP